MDGRLKDVAYHYYRIALIYAKKRQLDNAIECARYAVALDTENKQAVKLIALCLYELGEICEADKLLKDDTELLPIIKKQFTSDNNLLMQIKELCIRNKLRKAGLVAKHAAHQSVRILNIRGCICALNGKYGKAAVFFSKALEKDRGNRVAFNCLKVCLNRRKESIFSDFSLLIPRKHK